MIAVAYRKNVMLSKLMPWMLASRPKTLTAALVPVLVGTMLAHDALIAIKWELVFFALLGAFLIQIGTNFINDALDFKKGADTAERLGPLRATQSGQLTLKTVFWGGVVCFIAAGLCCIPLIIQGGWVIAILFVFSVICGYLYTGGPKPLAYHGLGDLFVFIFFGLVSTVSVFYLQAGFIDTKVVLAAVQIGFLATVLIAINNLRDCVGDAKAGKCTLAVRFGRRFARYEITLLVFLPFLFNFAWLAYDLKWAFFLPWLVFPLGLSLVVKIWLNPPSALYNKFLAQSALLHLTFGLLLTLAFAIS